MSIVWVVNGELVTDSSFVEWCTCVLVELTFVAVVIVFMVVFVISLTVVKNDAFVDPSCVGGAEVVVVGISIVLQRPLVN